MKANSALREIRRLRRDRTGIPRQPQQRQPAASRSRSSLSSSSITSMSTSSTRSSDSTKSSLSQRIKNSPSSIGESNRRRRFFNEDCEGEESMTRSLLNPRNWSRFSGSDDGQDEEANRDKIDREQNESIESHYHFSYRRPMFRKRWNRILGGGDDEESHLFSNMSITTRGRSNRFRDILRETDRPDYIPCVPRFKSSLRRFMNYLTMILLISSVVSLMSTTQYSRAVNRQHLTTASDEEKSLDNRTILERQIVEGVAQLDIFRNLTDSYNPMNDTAFFVDVPLTGSGAIKKIMSKCYDLTLACEVGMRQPNYDKDRLGVFDAKIYDESHMGIFKPTLIDQSYNGTFVNVDLSSDKGIKRASELNLMKSRLSDVVSMNSDILYESKQLFGSNGGSKGRMFVMFAEPIHRAVGYYHFTSNATWASEYNARVSKMTLHQYADSKFVPDNPMVRLLTNTKDSREISELELEIAKLVVKQKVLVGIYEEIIESLERFDRYFSWDVLAWHRSNKYDEGDDSKKKEIRQEVQQCSYNAIEGGDRWLEMQSELKGVRVAKESDLWKKLGKSNHWDLKLYDYAKSIYETQGERIFELGFL